jgi:hypothetical protein
MILGRLKQALVQMMSWVNPTFVHHIRQSHSVRAAARREACEWDVRIADVLACPDNKRIPKHPNAGRIRGNLQTLFNGMQVVVDGYYGTGMTRLLRKNMGSHEPQEELVFQDVLQRLPTGARMLECGAYWAFYSLWFAREVTDGHVWLIEPEAENLEVGRKNFTINGLRAHFTRAMVGCVSAEGNPPVVCIDNFLEHHQVDHLEILHADIQGAEVDMLRGSARALSTQQVDYIFISTHGESLHSECIDMLRGFDYEVAVSIRPCESFSVDGLVVAHRKRMFDTPLLMPSRKHVCQD